MKRTGFVQARKTAGYTQGRLAEALHIACATVQNWESGTREPSPRFRPAMARLLGLSLDELNELLRPDHTTPPKEAMPREPEHLVERRRMLGAQLAACRKAKCLRQEDLAKATYLDRSSIAHIERGTTRANDERFWRLADDVLSANGELVKGFKQWEAARNKHELQRQEQRLAELKTKNSTTAPGWSDDGIERVSAITGLDVPWTDEGTLQALRAVTDASPYGQANSFSRSWVPGSPPRPMNGYSPARPRPSPRPVALPLPMEIVDHLEG